MIVIGFDPGLATLGFGVIEATPSTTKVLAHGMLGEPDASLSHAERLNRICRKVDARMNTHCPDALGFEAQAGVHVGRDREGQPTHISLRYVHAVTGILRMAAMTALAEPIGCYEPQPVNIKIAVLGRGYGHAEKSQVQAAVKRLFGVRCNTHEADAIATAVCALRMHRLAERAQATRAAAAVPR